MDFTEPSFFESKNLAQEKALLEYGDSQMAD